MSSSIARGALRLFAVFVACLVMASIVGACSTIGAPATPFGPVGVRGGPIATAPPIDCPRGTLCAVTGHAVFGTLHEADGCVWLVWEGSEEDVRIVWPNGYSARYDPFVVLDAGGRTVARGGDVIHADGSGPFAGDADACGRTSWVSLVDGFLIDPTAAP